MERTPRQLMVKALRERIGEDLRRTGFSGSFPHYRRTRTGASIVETDLITFQFDRHGGGFVIEVGRHMGADFATSWGATIALKDLRAWDLHPSNRTRIQDNDTTGGTEGWFRFDNCKIYDEFLPVAEAAAQKLLKKRTYPGPAEPLFQEEKLTIGQRFKKVLLNRWN